MACISWFFTLLKILIFDTLFLPLGPGLRYKPSKFRTNAFPKFKFSKFLGFNVFWAVNKSEWNFWMKSQIWIEEIKVKIHSLQRGTKFYFWKQKWLEDSFFFDFVLVFSFAPWIISHFLWTCHFQYSISFFGCSLFSLHFFISNSIFDPLSLRFPKIVAT